ncbi:MAG: branched-chain amino acid ABC transporter permease [Hyphomicrobiales bacterium]|nr:branched-chain amino acid ABC transporter permease [Hyphomicrobiales bacterium]
MSFWLLQTLNGLAFGSLLFLLSAGFSLIFGLVRIPNLSHGGLFMLGAYLGIACLAAGANFWVAAAVASGVTALLGGAIERWLLRRLGTNEFAQVLATIGITFIISDVAIAIWGGDPLSLSAPEPFRRSVEIAGFVFPLYRLVICVVALVVAGLLWLAIDKTRIGAMLRAGVDDPQMARGIGIPVLSLFTLIFCIGAGLAGLGGVLAGPILSAYPGLDMDMLPLALIVVIFGGVGSLLGAFTGSYIIGLLYTLSQTLLPDLAYVVLFVPMVLVLAVRPRGLFGRVAV